ncbi:hypothetical protein PXW92_03635 [Staphylococcus hominis]|uniref:hypothetical protein n=1 Tax=Staphylococcus hominis TaxID=1290 RepID=UPI0012DCF81F|nr:hypothetical protein [Staphylococcus hominis]MDS0980481.1 hypothetical protein [Staphylococcus hominis]QGR78542.1 hypothetical protein FOC54_00630 [Staphylococcus hominis]
MKRELNTTEQHFATTRAEAERIVQEARDEEKSNLTSQKIDSKSNKYGEYYIVTLKFTFNTPKEIMAYE